MCDRLNLTDAPVLHDLLGQLNIDVGPLPTRYNIAPTDHVPVIHCWEGKQIISDMRWWLVPHWCSRPTTKYAMFKARCENLETSRAYQGCFRHKRGVVVVQSYVAWKKEGADKLPYLFSPVGQGMALAGLWDYWTDGVEHILSCSIVTTEAAPELKRFYHRMPVMLDQDGARLWLDQKQALEEIKPLFESNLPFKLRAVPIDKRYNNSRDKGPPLLLSTPVVLG